MVEKIAQLTFFLVLLISCGEKEMPPATVGEMEQEEVEEMEQNNTDLVEGIDFFLPKIDLNNWKVTLPIGNPTEVKPPEILDYANSELLKDFMYNDSTDGSLVFYTYPGSTTTNSSYSRTELREQMVPGSNSTNWTFAEGGRMKGSLAVTEISQDDDGDPHRTTVMQIHGRLINEQRVGTDRFTVEIKAEIGRMEVVLNETESIVYDGIHIEKWGIFENYF